MYSKEKLLNLTQINPEITLIILAAKDAEEARVALLNETKKIYEENHDAILNLTGLEFSLQLSCIRAFRQMLSIRSAKLAGFDLIHLLYNIVHKKYDLLPKDLSDSFIEDITNILMGTLNHEEIYEPLEEENLEGRKAGIARSENLNQLCQAFENKIAAYKSGLDPDVKLARQKNQARIMKELNCTLEEFANYKWQLKNIIRDAATLEKLVGLSPDEKKAIDLAKANGIPFGITPYYASLFDEQPDSPHDMAVRTQVIPPISYVEKVIEANGANSSKNAAELDFMLEHNTSPIDLITRRYPKIVVFKPYNTCSQICVYCQRNWEIDDAYIPQALASREKIDAAINWIGANPSVCEVLLTGGDPLVMSDENLEYILQRLSTIPSVTRIRIGSRTPVALPQRLDYNLVELLAKYHQPGAREIALVTHFEHSYEITPESMEAIRRLKLKGISCYNQAVFTIQNSRRFELCALRRWLRLIGVEPYYTFNAKGKEETDFYRVPLARLQQEVKEEARLQPGLERTDEPVYNVPGLGKNYLRAEQNHLLLTILPNGRRVYEFYPWEKFIANAESYIHTDIPIYEYLQRLEKLGEDPEDYKSIYYYF